MNTIILAGGKSSRMGENKALMKIGGIRVIDRIAAELGPESDKMIVVANDPAVYEHMDAVILEDEPAFKGQGPLVGIYTGLKEVGEGPCLIVACDMPFVSAGLGCELVSILKRNDRDAVVPIHEGRMHPLLAAYDARVSDIVKETLEDEKRSVRALLDRIDVEYFTIKEETLDVWNMNTMEEYIHAEKLAEGREGK
ncbi:putative molybdenum cofactor guanylyltransferase [Siminovitchia terrae]|uniref:Probable molybdenum cofactor guanylyltransferase n=1 Tax=Siminovitchia terrae TaxID=1914933 RepID=A0ABQ4KZW9_SIMTE|nr:molybdenum cofactor guanylyltransferase [Siminovitchia terrae]GIN90785.1 putative molybdenum cofactor guanylyltransferase [Siminovitchia terrae]GIN97561.1 putative molybdenum cofactor guanylyltransferase [Siminovitchia terrae]